MSKDPLHWAYSNPAKSKKKNKSPEHDIQVTLVALLESIEPKPLYTATVGGVRLAIHTAKKMKDAGYSKGVPDLLIFTPMGMYTGLAIEVKTEKGRPSPEQIEWCRHLNSLGWRAEITKGLDEAIDVIYEYFELYNESV